MATVKSVRALPSVTDLLLWSFTLFTAVYLIASPKLAAQSVVNALTVCTHRLIPSLFMFIALQKLFILSGLAELLPLGWLARVYRLPKVCGSVILLGALGGFPSGATAARELYELGELDKKQAGRLVALSNNAGLAFCVGGIGEALFGDTKLGLTLWGIQLAAGLAVGRLMLSRGDNADKAEAEAENLRRIEKSGKAEQASAMILKRITPSKALGMLAQAVSGACEAMIKICGFAIFFAVIGELVCKVISGTMLSGSRLGGLGSVIAAVIGSMLELTLGTGLASKLGGRVGLAICGFAAGFGGLSVQAQIAAVLSGSGISGRECGAAKLMQGVLTALAVVALA